jgi:N-acetylmuramoyl-L-alanine amidase
MIRNPATSRSMPQSRARKSMPLDIIQSPSPNFDDRKRPIRFIVLHYTGMQSADGALRVLSDPLPQRTAYLNEIPANPLLVDGRPADRIAIPDPMSKVSSHYLAYEDGRMFQLVDEAKRAWHAGRGSWDGETDMNSCTVGIEIANGGHDFGLPDFPEAQIQSVMTLVRNILDRHGLDRRAVIGHSDLAPSRKPDPGEKFPWKRLAQEGLSIWPEPGPEDGDQRVLFETLGTMDAGISAVQTGLGTIGYGVTVNGTYDGVLKDIIRAFQRRFRQSKADGIIDVETVALIGRVAALLRQPV